MKGTYSRHNSHQIGFRQRRRLLLLFVLFNFIFAGSIVVLPLVLLSDETMPPLRCLIGALFWIGLIGLVAVVILINYKRRQSRGFKSVKNGKKKIGLINFFQNNYATVADVLMFISLLAVIILEWVARIQSIAISVFGVFIFSFNMHCLLNGIYYEYLKHNDRRVNNR